MTKFGTRLRFSFIGQTSGKVGSISKGVKALEMGKKNLRIMKVEEALLFVLFLGRKGVRMYHVANTVVGFEVGRI
jgi:hypothetical protein